MANNRQAFAVDAGLTEGPIQGGVDVISELKERVVTLRSPATAIVE
jgi:hypothetical protein